ncbi:MAG: S8 family serine peptidase [Planctomycetota bacterium]|nr:S8 family serine peptidase [Planctomycetota bacterium]
MSVLTSVLPAAEGVRDGEPVAPVIVGSAFHPTRLLVRTKPGMTAKQLAAADKKAGVVKVIYKYNLVPGLRCVEVKPGKIDAALKAYRSNKQVAYANRDAIRYALDQTVPYGVTNVRAPEVWSATRGRGAVVAVLDTGFDFGHPDLPVPVLSQSFINGETAQDGFGHGSHCSGTVLGVDNTQGVIGVAPSASLMIGKVLSDSGSGPSSGVIAGIDWAVTNRANVISLSLGSTGSEQAEADVCAAAVAANVMVIAAAGNNNSGDPFYPASYPGVLSVAAVDSANQRASFSNFGPQISVSAPGVNVLSTVPTGLAQWADTAHDSAPLAGSGSGTVTAMAISCGLGGDAAAFPAEVAGNIAFIRRGGGITFATKATNAVNAGAIGVIIANNAVGLFNGTLNADFTIPVVGVSQADGDDLLSRAPITVTISDSGGHGYAYYSGTSMACPHVSGVAALLISEFGASNITPALVRQALEVSATDLGDPGRDDLFGYGLVNVAAARFALRDLIGLECDADFDVNGGVDGRDVEAFFLAWESRDFRADINFDGAFDSSDVAAFVSTWARGGC